jgi:NAD+ synthase
MNAEMQKAVVWDTLKIDYAAESKLIATTVRRHVHETLKRHGVVVALSGGIDSSVVGALCVQALGSDRCGLRRKNCPPRQIAESGDRTHLSIPSMPRHHDLLSAAGCYRYRDRPSERRAGL